MTSDVPPELGDRSAEWLGTEGNRQGAKPTSTEESLTSRSASPALIAIGILVAALLAVTAFRGETDDVAQPPTSQPPRPADTEGSEAEIGTPEGGSLGLGFALQAVVTDPVAGDARLVSIDGNGEVSDVALPALANFEFDSSGRWLAGTSVTRHDGPRRVLWAGPVGGLIEPVAVGARGFAWHEDVAGRLAWTNTAGERITVADLSVDEPDTTIDLPIDGRVRGFGRWGFAIETSFRSFATTIVGPEGTVVVEETPGRYSSYVPGLGLILSGGNGAPVAIDETNWTSRPVPWLGTGDYVWDAAVSGDDGTTAALIGRQALNAESFAADVVLVTEGSSSRIIGRTSAFTDLALTTDQTGILLVDQRSLEDERGGTIRLIELDGSRAELEIPNLFAGREWVAALSIDPGGL